MKSKAIFTFLIVTILAGIWAASQLSFKTDMTAYNLAADKDTAQYEAFIDTLQPRDWKQTIIIIERTLGWRTMDDFLLLDSLVKEWESYPEIDQISSLTNLRYPKQRLFLPTSESFLDLNHQGRFESRLQEWDKYSDITDKFLSKNKKYSLLFVSFKEEITSPLATHLQNSIQKSDGLRVHFVQYDLIQTAVDKMVKNDTVLLTALSLILVLVGFYLFTFSLRGLLLIALIIAFNVSGLFLIMYVGSIPFTMHMISIPCIITVLSFTDIMHILYYQQQEYQAVSTDQALQLRILSTVGTPLLLTSLTNSIGFIVFLLFAKNIYLFQFSLIAFLGVVIAYGSARLLVIPLMTTRTIYVKRNQFEFLHSLHDQLSGWFKDRRRYLLPSFIVVFLVLLLDVSAHFRIDNLDHNQNMKASPLASGQAILQEHFFGAKRAEIFVALKTGSVWDKAVLDRLEWIEAQLAQDFSPFYINSPLMIVRRYHRYLSNGEPAAFAVPHKLNDTYQEQLSRFQNKLGGDGIVDTTATKARMVFGFHHLPLHEARSAYAKLAKVLEEQSDEVVQFELSGLQYLSDEATYQFSVKVLWGLLVSIVFGSILVLYWLKSWRKSVGVFLVNSFPLLFALALLLYWGVAISPMTLFLLSVLLGICVDDSIYLIIQHSNGEHRVHLVPIFITSFVLSLGFLSLNWAHFAWLQPFGFLFLLGISLAYLLDFFVLPLFLKNHLEE